MKQEAYIQINIQVDEQGCSCHGEAYDARTGLFLQLVASH